MTTMSTALSTLLSTIASAAATTPTTSAATTATAASSATTTTATTTIATIIVATGGRTALDFFDVLAGEHRVIELDTAEKHRLMDAFGLREFEEETHGAIVFDVRHGADAEGVVVGAAGNIRGIFFDGAGQTL